MSEDAPITPLMSRPEAQLLSETIDASSIVLEYGCGGSTLLAIKAGKKITSVESDPQWLATDPIVAEAVAEGRARLLHCDLGPVGGFGRPRGEATKELWPTYATMPWEQGLEAPDFVFVDGRFRVACILESLRRIGDDARLAVHDFWNRPHYHDALAFLDWQASAGSLGVFKRRASIDLEKLDAVQQAFRYDVR